MAYFSGKESVKDLIEEWTDTDWVTTADDVMRHNLIPIRLLYMGKEGWVAILHMRGSRSASSNANLMHARGQAILQLGVEGVLLASKREFSDEIAQGLYAMSPDDRRILIALLDQAKRQHPDGEAQIERFRSQLPD
ncbi:MAG: hypothetical protein IH851_04810 [Armatimonadetes bacterium]|nr:hypothetical protein [Armatimonadota bacterium]